MGLLETMHVPDDSDKQAIKTGCEKAKVLFEEVMKNICEKLGSLLRPGVDRVCQPSSARAAVKLIVGVRTRQPHPPALLRRRDLGVEVRHGAAGA